MFSGGGWEGGNPERRGGEAVKMFKGGQLLKGVLAIVFEGDTILRAGEGGIIHCLTEDRRRSGRKVLQPGRKDGGSDETVSRRV